MRDFTETLSENIIYKPEEILDVWEMYCDKVRTVKSKGIAYYNVPLAFDIETSSFYQGDEKRAIMYIWQVSINGAIIIGRTWPEFFKMLEDLSRHLDLHEKKRIILWVHSLSFEFQWIRHWLEWEKVFSLDLRRPVYAVCSLWIEFRCSYILSGYSLKKLGDELQRYHVQKMSGDLDYTLLRNEKTELTPEELRYCVNDVRVVTAYIREQMEDYGRSIARLPLTNTGRVRTFCRESCFYTPGADRKKDYKKMRYLELMHSLTLSGLEEYDQLKDGFQGGFTHGNHFYIQADPDGPEMIQYGASSYDFTSAYPFNIVARQYPMGQGELIQIRSDEELWDSLNYYCCLFEIEIWDLQSVVTWESYISASHCHELQGAVLNNGRVFSAKHLRTTVTEQDYFIIRKCYTWPEGSLRISNFRRYKKAYLPTDLIKAVLKLYKDKTELKGVAGKEVEYLRSKGMLNAVFGMMVTDILRPDILYGEEWPDIKDLRMPDEKKAELIDKYNRSNSRFTFFPWGIWVCAYNRRNLWTAILELGPEDYLYSDTDSVKILHREKHLEYFENYNRQVIRELEAACEYHKIPLDAIRPKTIKGVEKILGVWDYEGDYKRFKTLGAKRYITESPEGKIEITVAGLGKKAGAAYLIKKGEGDPERIFREFNNHLLVPAGETGKSTHTYIDRETAGVCTDYQGHQAAYYEKSSLHMEAASYDLHLGGDFVSFLLGEHEEESA